MSGLLNASSNAHWCVLSQALNKLNGEIVLWGSKDLLLIGVGKFLVIKITFVIGYKN